MKEKEAQREGRNKETVINKSYIESGEYRRKFDRLTDNKEVNRILYNCAKEILYHRNGTVKEDMYWIDAHTAQIVAKEIEQNENSKIAYSKSTRRKIEKRKNLITIHTHPYSYPPSIEDLNSNKNNGYILGIICCHDGKVFMYKSDKCIVSSYYKKVVEVFIKQGYNEYEAQMRALRKMEEQFAIKVMEVL